MTNELKVVSGISGRGDNEVLIEVKDGFGAYGNKRNWRKVQESKKGKFVIVDKKRVYIEIPTKGEWIIYDSYGNVSTNGCGSNKWVGETITIQY